MSDIGSYEAKTQLSKLLARVKKGERFTITVHGHPVAELVPLTRPDPETARRAIEELMRLRNGYAKRGFRLRSLLKRGETLRALAHKGHRY